MKIEELIKLLKTNRQNKLYHRYISNDDIEPLLNNLNEDFLVDKIGVSVEKRQIYAITIGNGPKKVLMWSQMHGNESTTTKAIFDLLNILSDKNEVSNALLTNCTLKIIPILNPDGAYLYTRTNVNDIDLNRDAQNLSQPESDVLLNVFNDFKPNFCFNLHGQRTIFSAGKYNKPATVSFLAPAQDEQTTITQNRKQAMEIIVKMNDALQLIIPNQVGIYDDSFNINCVGDTFQSKGVPTILFEAGHYKNDYPREKVREYIGLALLTALKYISNHEIRGEVFAYYNEIPLNEKMFFDIIIRNAKLTDNEGNCDVAIQFKEFLNNNEIQFIPVIEKIGHLSEYFGHKEIDANDKLVLTSKKEKLFEGYENDFVLLNNELFSLKSTISML